MEWRNQVAVVTGGSRGIGRASPCYSERYSRATAVVARIFKSNASPVGASWM